MKFVGASQARTMEGLRPTGGISNYFLGADPGTWRTNIQHYTQVAVRNIYPGIDLIYYGRDKRLEYDFIVAPGADPSAIALDFEDADACRLDDANNLVLHLGDKQLIFHAPRLYQEQDGKKTAIAGQYRLQGNQRVKFVIGPYQATKPLIIDPVLDYSTYLGGGGTDVGNGIAVDSAGNMYVVGSTYSCTFPTTPGAFQTTCSPYPKSDIFVSKFNPSGSVLLYSTYLGGSGGSGNSQDDYGLGIAVDQSGNAYITGQTGSTDFPTTPGAFQRAYGGSFTDAFVTKLNANGSALVYSTFLGGDSYENGNSIAIDSLGNAYIVGENSSRNFPTVNAFQTCEGPWDAFVSKLNAAGSGLIYSTCIGGTTFDNGYGIAVDGTGAAYITGTTNSADFPVTAGAFDTKCGVASEGCSYYSDGFVAKFSSAGLLVYSTYIGGSNIDDSRAIAIDGSGNVYIAGDTYSTDFPTKGAFQARGSGGADGVNVFVTKLNNTGSGLVYSTYLGGFGLDMTWAGIAVDAAGSAYVVGDTEASDFPVVLGIQTDQPGRDIFITKFSPDGGSLLFSTYLGGSGAELARGIAVDGAGTAYVVGYTYSSDFLLKSPYQASKSVAEDVIVVKLNTTGPVTYSISGSVTQNGKGLALATVTLTGSDNQSVLKSPYWMNVYGDYRFLGLSAGGNYTVRAYGYAFTQPSQVFSNLMSNQIANFTADPNQFSLWGQVTVNGVGLGGVKMALSGSRSASTSTDGFGYYGFALSPGDYTITPSAEGYGFSPGYWWAPNAYYNVSGNFAAGVAPTLLSPSNGATGVSPAPTLSWNAVAGATSYDVYFDWYFDPKVIVSNTAATSYALPGPLWGGNTYYWKVAAKNSTGSFPSSIWSFTVQPAVPPAPTLYSPANAATGVALNTTLSWGAASAATSYDVYFGTASSPPLVGNTAGFTYAPSALSANTTYYWKVAAKNSTGSTSSGTWSFTTQVAAPPPAPNLSSPANAATGAALNTTLNWSAAAGATSYDVYFGTAASPPLVGNTAGFSYAPSALSANTTYYWKVAAKNSAGSTSSGTWSFSTLVAAPPAPTLSWPANGATGVALTTTLNWSAAAGATSYDVYFGAASSPPLVGNTAATSYAPGMLNAVTTYYWKIVAKNPSGSASSAIWSFTTNTVGAGNVPPSITSLSPFVGSGNATFTTVFDDANGWPDIAHARVLVGSTFAPQAACYVDYNPASNAFSLMNDAGTAWSSTVLSNSQCTLTAASSSGSGSGRTLTVNFSLQFSASFTGQRAVFQYVQDASNAAPDPLGMGIWYPVPVTASLIKRYRLYDTRSRTHHYTTDAYEYSVLGASGFVQEGVDSAVYSAPITVSGVASVPFWRIYAAQNTSHFWTTDRNEYTTLIRNYPGIYIGEGADTHFFLSTVPGSIALYRLVFMDAGPPIHHWTTDAYEYSVLSAAGGGWQAEGISGYLFQASAATSSAPGIRTSAAGGHRHAAHPEAETTEVLLVDVMNPASHRTGRIVAGQAVRLVGYGLTTGNLPRVFFDGLEAPVTMLGGWLEAVAPLEVAGRDAVQVELVGEGLRSAIQAQVVEADPGVWTDGILGMGQAVAVNEDGNANGADHPAARGEAVWLRAVDAGCRESVVRVGAVPAEVIAREPQEDGSSRLKIRIPESVASGAAAPVSIQCGERRSQVGATVAVR